MANALSASRQWMTRPADERFINLHELHAVSQRAFENSNENVVSSKRLRVMPDPTDEIGGLVIEHNANEAPSHMTHWSFGQISSLVSAPAKYLRTLPAPIAADALNYGIQFNRETKDTGLLLTREAVDQPARIGLGDLGGVGFTGASRTEMRAATGPNYGRIWNKDIVGAMIDRFGDGVTGDFKVPGEFGKDVVVNRDNTTIYGSDRDMFVFLADEKNRVNVANRRDGKAGSLARGFFVWNSEVGSQSVGAAFFLFDFVCQNRIVWGMEEFKEIRIRHTASAPDRWLEEISPVLMEYSNAAAGPVEEVIRNAQNKKVEQDLDVFLRNRFTVTQSDAIKRAHEAEEGRPMETLWDVTTGATAFAKSIRNQDERVKVERTAGNILNLVA